MDKNLENIKQQLSQELSWLLNKAISLRQTAKAEDLEFNYEQAIKKLTQLYYYNLYQIDSITNIAKSEKEIVKQNILKDWQANLVRLMVLYNQLPAK